MLLTGLKAEFRYGFVVVLGTSSEAILWSGRASAGRVNSGILALVFTKQAGIHLLPAHCKILVQLRILKLRTSTGKPVE